MIRLSTDGFTGNLEAVDLAFGPYAEYCVLIKEFRNATMPYTPSEIVGTRWEVVKGNVDPWDICTSHVERHNLTVRTFMKPFARLSRGFSKKLECLEAGLLQLRPADTHRDDSGKPSKLRPTAAMMANVTDHLWNFDEFYETVIQYG